MIMDLHHYRKNPYYNFLLFDSLIIKQIPIKINGAPSKELIAIASPNMNQPNMDAIIGSPRGTDAIAVGDKYFKA